MSRTIVLFLAIIFIKATTAAAFAAEASHRCGKNKFISRTNHH